MLINSHVNKVFIDKIQTGLASKLLSQPSPRLCTMLDLLWTFLDESALCDVLEHCVVRECLLFDLVSQVIALLVTRRCVIYKILRFLLYMSVCYR